MAKQKREMAGGELGIVVVDALLLGGAIGRSHYSVARPAQCLPCPIRTDITIDAAAGRSFFYYFAEANNPSSQPLIAEIKDFLLIARRKDARSIKIKRSKDVVKFQVRCKKYLCTLCVFDFEKPDKL
ncbi:hypothetical protein L7F22_037792 [Adiantum nelumboides]|nr:hypothetical protein [Adiantum nelumboides]